MSARGRENADERILLALACGATYSKAAQDSGVGERTVEQEWRLARAWLRARLEDGKRGVA